MKRKFPYFLVLFVILLTILIIQKFDQYILKSDYLIEVSVECDINQENCLETICEEVDCEQEYFKIYQVPATIVKKCSYDKNCIKNSCEETLECS